MYSWGRFLFHLAIVFFFHYCLLVVYCRNWRITISGALAANLLWCCCCTVIIIMPPTTSSTVATLLSLSARMSRRAARYHIIIIINIPNWISWKFQFCFGSMWELSLPHFLSLSANWIQHCSQMDTHSFWVIYSLLQGLACRHVYYYYYTSSSCCCVWGWSCCVDVIVGEH